MARKRTNHTRVYTKKRKGAQRFYADFRDFAEHGGKLEALIEPGSRFATTDPQRAEELAKARLQELERLQKSRIRVESGVLDITRLGPFTEHHLKAKALARKVGLQWLESAELHLDTAVGYFGAGKKLLDITVPELTEYLGYLYTLESGRKNEDGSPGHLSEVTCRKYLNSLSNLFVRAIAEGILPLGHNPVANMLDKPSNLTTTRPEWLEVWQAALLLHAARTYEPKREDLALPFAYELIATLLLSGGRFAEVAGLQVGDVDLDRKIIVFWKNSARRLKNRGSCRVVPLWPQLEAILRAYLDGPNRPTGQLLFPVQGPKGEHRVKDIRKLLDRLAERMSWQGAPIRSKAFRHTYCAARLQTLDHGKPVAMYTVSQELGHGSEEMVKEVYAHLGQMRHRSSEVEYRVEQWEEVLGNRVAEVERLNREEATLSRKLTEPKNSIGDAVTKAVVLLASEQPRWGQDRVAAVLAESGLRISASSVRGIWVKHGLETREKRLAVADPVEQRDFPTAA